MLYAYYQKLVDFVEEGRKQKIVLVLPIINIMHTTINQFSSSVVTSFYTGPVKG